MEGIPRSSGKSLCALTALNLLGKGDIYIWIAAQSTEYLIILKSCVDMRVDISTPFPQGLTKRPCFSVRTGENPVLIWSPLGPPPRMSLLPALLMSFNLAALQILGILLLSFPLAVYFPSFQTWWYWVLIYIFFLPNRLHSFLLDFLVNWLHIIMTTWSENQ